MLNRRNSYTRYYGRDRITFQWNGSRTVNVFLNGRAVDIWTYGDVPTRETVERAISEYPTEAAFEALRNL